MTSHSLMLLPGDGIGPEVMAEVHKVMDWLQSHTDTSFEIEEDLIGGCAIDEYGTSLADDTLENAARPMPSCWARSAGRNGTMSNMPSAPKPAF